LLNDEIDSLKQQFASLNQQNQILTKAISDQRQSNLDHSAMEEGERDIGQWNNETL
jgi:hypothetical protein